MLCKLTYIDTFMPIYEPKCPIPIMRKFVELFDISKIDTLTAHQNDQSLTVLFKNPNQGM